MTFNYPYRVARERLFALLAVLVFSFSCADAEQGAEAADDGKQASSNSYESLVELFEDWRDFENPPLKDGAPDYTAERFSAAYAELPEYFERLEAIDTNAWPVEQKVDWHVVRAEMNGFDFNHRVLKPWVRDPAFYQSIWTRQSDVPAHEGPTHHAVVELWLYDFPLSDSEEKRLTRELGVIPPLMKQAQGNLTGNARDLWVAGIRNIEAQRGYLDDLENEVDDSASKDLKNAIASAQEATDQLVSWLKSEAPSKTGPSGVGKENYTWYQQNVHYVPLTWEDEVTLLKRELDRAWSSLKLEEHRNRNLPPQESASTAEEYDRMTDKAASELIAFLNEQEVMPVEDYMEPALREHLGTFVPEDRRNFFSITSHYDPKPLMSHSYHWIELARMREEPHKSPIRRGPLLYNIFDSRNEGTATAMEELLMQAGMHDANPRSRELVWIMLAQRAARGLGSLYAHANMMTMAEASTVHVEWTPREWMSNEPELLKFEQHMYLRQPGYGTSYVTGKYLLERLLAYRTKQMEGDQNEYTLSDFFEEYNEAGSVPTSLVHFQLTGDDQDIALMTEED